ncbi:MAG: membrane dipeptidase, partial [Nitrospira sp.]|nr:membrane dipeptidase [Nitrospira sp.]
MKYADAHADTFYHVALSGADVFGESLHVTVPRMRAVGQVLQVCSVFTPAQYSGEAAEDFARGLIRAIQDTCEGHRENFALVGSARELKRLNGRVGLIPWLEGASPLRGEPALLDEFRRLGVRGVGLVHNHANEVADGCGVQSPRRGLSDFGRRLVAGLERRGMAVDCAHLPRPAFDEVMEMATRPPCISHTGCGRLVPLTRNADDRMLRRIADRDGFVGIDFYPGHVLVGAFSPCRRRAGCAEVAEHILHAINVSGVGAVGLGGDFDGFNDTCEG